MNNNNLLMYGVVAVGAIFLYNRYTKKPTPQEEENQGGGGGGGGGGFFPMPIIPPIAPIIPIVTPLKGQVVVPTTLGGARPVVAVSSSSTGVGNSGTAVTNLGGIAPIPLPQRQTGSVVQITQADLNKGIAGGLVFKPFDGDMMGLRLENLVRSINRP